MVALFVPIRDLAMVLALFEAHQRGEAAFPGCGQSVPVKTYLIQSLTTLGS